MKPVHPEFPVYSIKNWHSIDQETFDKMLNIIIKNRDKNKIQGAASWWILDDQDGLFKGLYDKFTGFMLENFDITITPDNIEFCNVYYNSGADAVEVLDPHGLQYYHSHKHVRGHLGNPTTIAGVYYANIPDPNSGTIDFKKSEIQTPHGAYEFAKELEYHQMNKRPYEKIEGLRTTIVKEITYQPETGDLVLFPSYLEHRPHKSIKPGHRIAINFELKTKEHPDEIFASFHKKHNL
jgi:hypothetical protein